MITFICFVLYKLNAPWWVYVLSILGILLEFDSSNLVHRNDIVLHNGKIIDGDIINDKIY